MTKPMGRNAKDAMVLELFDLLMGEYFEFIGAATVNEKAGAQRIKARLKAMFGMGSMWQVHMTDKLLALSGLAFGCPASTKSRQ